MIICILDFLLVSVSIMTVAQIFLVTRPEESGIKLKYLLWVKDSTHIRFICDDFFKITLILYILFIWRLAAFMWWYFLGNPGDAMADQCRVLVLFSIIMMNACLRRTWEMCQADFAKFKALTLELSRKRALSWRPRSTISSIQRCFRSLVDVKSMGLDRVPRDGKQLLFICNHLIGPFDHPLLLDELSTRGVHPRGVTSTLRHWDMPIWSDVIRLLGGVSLLNVDVLIERGDAIIMYGAKKDEDEMEWISQADHGFVKVLRSALQNNYRVVPCACVGARDVVDMVYGLEIDPNRQSSIFGTILKRALGKQKKHLWYWFGEPMEMETIDSSLSNEERLVAIKQQVMDTATDGIGELFDMISQDNSVDKRILSAMRGRWQAISEKSQTLSFKC